MKLVTSYKLRVTSVLLLILPFAACKTTKQATKTDTQTHETAALDVRETASAIAAGTATLNVDSKVNTNEDMVEFGTRTKWSIPDQNGKQYPVETDNYTKGKKSNIKAETSAKAKENKTVGNRLSHIDKSDYKSDAKQKKEEKEQTKTTAPAGVSWGIVILTVGLLVLVYLVLKRFGVI